MRIFYIFQENVIILHFAFINPFRLTSRTSLSANTNSPDKFSNGELLEKVNPYTFHQHLISRCAYFIFFIYFTFLLNNIKALTIRPSWDIFFHCFDIKAKVTISYFKTIHYNRWVHGAPLFLLHYKASI